MYLKFFGLKKEPFNITPDPEFLFLSPSHKEALGSIIYGIEKRKGFISIVGEVGSGKTTIVRSYLERSNRDTVKPIYIFNSNLTFRELLVTVCADLGVLPDKTDVHNLINHLQQMLVESYRNRVNIVLIVDEAQNMPTETLEKLRMLSNLETCKEKLIQIVLIGQPELEDKLNLSELRQLKQRLSVKTIVRPLTQKESREYVKHRLSLSCSNLKRVFDQRAIENIIDHSKGIPRVINILCDNALVAGFGSKTRPVNSKIVKEVIRDYEGHVGNDRKLYVAAACMTILIVMLSTGYYVQANKNNLGQSILLSGFIKGANDSGKNEVRNEAHDVVVQEPDKEISSVDENIPSLGSGVTDVSFPKGADMRTHRQVESLRNAESHSVEGDGVAEKVTSAEQKVSNAVVPETLGRTRQPSGDFVKSLRNHDSSVVRVVREGDYLTKLCVEVYGVTNESIVNWVWFNNPWISNVDSLSVGDVIIFPQIEGKFYN